MSDERRDVEQRTRIARASSAIGGALRIDVARNSALSKKSASHNDFFNASRKIATAFARPFVAMSRVLERGAHGLRG